MTEFRTSDAPRRLIRAIRQAEKQKDDLRRAVSLVVNYFNRGNPIGDEQIEALERVLKEYISRGNRIMNRRGFLGKLLAASAAGVLVPEYLLDPPKGRSMVAVPDLPWFTLGDAKVRIRRLAELEKDWFRDFDNLLDVSFGSPERRLGPEIELQSIGVVPDPANPEARFVHDIKVANSGLRSGVSYRFERGGPGVQGFEEVRGSIVLDQSRLPFHPGEALGKRVRVKDDRFIDGNFLVEAVNVDLHNMRTTLTLRSERKGIKVG